MLKPLRSLYLFVLWCSWTLDVISVFLHIFKWHAVKTQTIVYNLICFPFRLGVQGKSVGAPANPNGDRRSLFTCAVEAQLGIQGSNSSWLIPRKQWSAFFFNWFLYLEACFKTHGGDLNSGEAMGHCDTDSVHWQPFFLVPSCRSGLTTGSRRRT